MIYQNVSELIGKTPLVKLENPNEREFADVFVKLEYFNIGKSVKDRIALNMVETAIREGKITARTTLVEASSGNTGIGLAIVCAVKKIPLIVILPEVVSCERKQLIRAYGATVIETSASGGIAASFEKMEELLRENQNYLSLRQFENRANPQIHFQTTAPEIIRALGAVPEAFVAGVGTGGTLTGVGSHFRELKKEVKIFAVEPEKSPVLSGGIASPHKIQGIGAGIIPEVLDTTLYDEVLRVTEEEAITQTRKLAEKGLLLGISSGAAIHAAFDVARKIGANKHVVVVAADNGERYLSTDIFAQKNYEEAKNE